MAQRVNCLLPERGKSMADGWLYCAPSRNAKTRSSFDLSESHFSLVRFFYHFLQSSILLVLSYLICRAKVIHSLILGSGISLVFGLCSEDQKSLLLELKNSLNYNESGSKVLVRWDQSFDYCNWVGVTCSDGCVIGLDLNSEGIYGGFDNSSSLFSLQHLKNLNLGYNNFNITIPTGFRNLINLITLNTSNAGFTGQIPIEISYLTQLITLDLSTFSFLQNSNLKVENPNLNLLLQNMTQLEELYLDGVDISVGGEEWGQALSSSLPNLRVLSLGGCNLSGPIDYSLLKIQFLSVIHLDNNNLSVQVPDFFAEYSNLTSLRLSSTRLLGVFPEKIFQVPTLEMLDLTNNRQLQGSLPAFPLNGTLQSLSLRDTAFSGPLPHSIGNLQKLSKLDLAGCNFNGSIPTEIANLGQLTFLDFSANRFSGPIPSFSSSKNLTLLNLAHNQLDGSILSTKWESLPGLVYLDLRNNSLDGSIPVTLFSIPSIQKIQLSQNQFNGDLNELSNVSSSLLDTLDLSSNHLGGSFPMSFFKLKGLKSLLMSHNNFSGPVQLNMIQQLQNLSSLDLSSNSLFVVETSDDLSYNSTSPFPQMTSFQLASCGLRRFPEFLKNQTKLNVLDLSHNQLQGNVPTWIWKLENLRILNLSSNSLVGLEGPLQDQSRHLLVLDLRSNEFQGALPFVNSSQPAAYLDYSNNNFSSVIPKDIGKYLDSAIFFSISNNSVSGSIPTSLCNATSLQVLDLSDNMLHGSVPTCLYEITDSLGVLNLRGNNLNGSLSDTFPSGCRLRTLDVSGNQIEGKVPQSLSNCTMLEVFDVGKNSLHDAFPCSLKKIPTLRVLVLRSNGFHGKIDCSYINGTWLSLQIVDVGQNHFTGGLPGRCLMHWKAMMADEDGEKSKLNHLRYRVLNFSDVNYQDSITVTTKGLEMDFVKILTVFTYIDFSSNDFDGPIPEELGQLKALYGLNLSHNSLTGQIPPAIGNLTQLESLDLSSNKLSGAIPYQLGFLNFLSFLNVSFNNLVGKIPTGTQLQLFTEDSFRGNKGLCGPPLTVFCNDSAEPQPSSPSRSLVSDSQFDWQFIFVGVGFGVGAAATVALLAFWETGRKWSDDIVDRILLLIIPMMGLIYTTSHEAKLELEEDNKGEKTDIAEYDEDDEDEPDDKCHGQYCVFCSKLDVFRKRVIHDPQCTCHFSPPFSLYSSISLSSA